MTLPAYCTVEMARAAFDMAPSVRLDAQIKRAVFSASRRVDADLGRIFYPLAGTYSWPWPPDGDSDPWVLEFGNGAEAISVSAVTSGGTALDSGSWFLEPGNSGPPYDRLEVDLSTSASLESGSTTQRSIAVTGVWGYGDDTEDAGELTALLTSSAATLAVDAAGSVAVGIGDALLVEDEYLIVTGRTWSDTGDALVSGLEASKADDAVTVSDGTAFVAGETILVGTERMLVLDIAGDVLSVDRAVDGTTLAVHSTSDDVYAPRSLTVARGALGTTAAEHVFGTTVARHLPPYDITAYALAEVLNQLEQERSGYARTVASGEAEREASGAGLASARQAARDGYSRKRARTMAV